MKFIEIHWNSIKLDMVCFLVNCNVAVLFLDDEFDDHLAPICYHIQHNLLDEWDSDIFLDHDMCRIWIIHG